MLRYILRLLKGNLVIITFIIAFGIAVLSLIKMGNISTPKVGNGDKIGHCVAYTALSFFALISFSKRKVIWVISLCIIYGLVMEFLQSLTSYRTADIADALANSIGVFIGFCLSKLYSQEK